MEKNKDGREKVDRKTMVTIVQDEAPLEKDWESLEQGEMEVLLLYPDDFITQMEYFVPLVCTVSQDTEQKMKI